MKINNSKMALIIKAIKNNLIIVLKIFFIVKIMLKKSKLIMIKIKKQMVKKNLI